MIRILDLANSAARFQALSLRAANRSSPQIASAVAAIVGSAGTPRSAS